VTVEWEVFQNKASYL